MKSFFILHITYYRLCSVSNPKTEYCTEEIPKEFLVLYGISLFNYFRERLHTNFLLISLLRNLRVRYISKICGMQNLSLKSDFKETSGNKRCLLIPSSFSSFSFKCPDSDLWGSDILLCNYCLHSPALKSQYRYFA